MAIATDPDGIIRNLRAMRTNSPEDSRQISAAIDLIQAQRKRIKSQTSSLSDLAVHIAKSAKGT